MRANGYNELYLRGAYMNKQTQQIFEHFGIEAQKMKLIEEMAELTKEIVKRKGKQNEDERKRHIIRSELADVSIVLEQLIEYYGKDFVEYIKQAKIERTLERINSGYYEESK